MFIPQTAHYVHKADKDRFLGVAQSDQFFCVVAVDKGVSKEQGTDFIGQLEDEVEHVSLSHLAKFETWIQDVITQANFPAQFSLAAGAVYEDILYLKTVGDGQIYLRRGDQFAKLIQGTKSASGHVKESDFVIFTTQSFAGNFPEQDELKKLVSSKKPEELVPAIETYETDIDERDCIALFVEFGTKEKEKPVVSADLDTKVIANSEEEAVEREKTPPVEKKKEHDIHSPILVDDPSSLDPPSHPTDKSKEQGEKQEEDDEIVEKTYAHPPSGSSFSDTLASEAEKDMFPSEIEKKKESLQGKEDKLAQPTQSSTGSVDDLFRTSGEEKPSEKPTLSDTLEEEEPSPSQKPWQKLHLKERFASMQSNAKEVIVVGNAKNLFQSKKVLVGIAVGIFVLLGISIFFSNQKLQQQKAREKIQTSQDTITEKLEQAEEISFLNPERSVLLLTEARDELSSLRDSLSEEEQQRVEGELAELTQQIDAFEEEILQKEEKEYTEFYDLALEEEDAQGTELFLNEDRVAIVDPGNQSLYVLSLEEKSLEKRKSDAIGQGTLPALFDDDILLYVPSKGVYRFTNEEGDIEQLVEYNEDWGSIVDIGMYFGNIYLLDSEQDDIYKFIRAQNGYGGGGSYFLASHSHDFSTASGMAIDASIYVGLKDEILKFTRGEDDEFNTTFPYEEVNLSDVYTDEEAGNVYAWDKTQGSIYVLDKNGRYEREIYTEMLKEANDFVVYQNNLYVLSGAKIFLIEDGE